jgi:trimeric autotransporter adhesin
MSSERYRISIYQILKAILLLLAVVTSTRSQAQTATTTALTVLAGGSPVSTVSTGTAITLTATVTAAGSTIKQGQVNFCTAAAAHCADINVLGVAALNATGKATLILRPDPGAYTYKAEFIGTPGAATPYAASVSTSAALTVTGFYQSAATITPTGAPGNYTLTASIYGFDKNASAPAPTGTVSFLDTTTNNSTLTTAALSASAPGPYWFDPAAVSVGGETGSIVSGDFNNDGNPDFAIGLSNATPPLAVYLGDGHGGFSMVSNSSITASGSPVLVADFNGDGKPDILLSDDSGGSALTVLLGNGDGTFTPAPGSPISTNYGAAPIVCADFNGDGIPDLAVAGGYYLVVLLGNGDGTFTQMPTSSSIAQADLFSGMVTGDFNGDGKQDIAVVDDTLGQTITLYLGNGDGTFTQGSSIAVSSESGSSAVNLVAADFNGDGNLDLATPINGNPGLLAIYLGNGGGAFTPASGSPVSTIEWSNIVQVGDFNGDGIPDIYVTGATNTQDLAIYLGNGDGTFTLVPAANTPEVPCCFNTTLSDFNNDGVTDIAASSFYYGQADIYLTTPTLSTATASNISITGQSPQDILASYPGDSTYNSSQSATTPLEIPAAAPTFTPTPGTIAQTQSITITTTTPGAAIYYQASGAYDISQWTLFSGPLQFPARGTLTIQAFATATNYGQSATTTAQYTLVPMATPTLTVTPGTTSITTKQALSVAIAVEGGSGYPIPTGTVILSGGGYTSAPVTLSGGAATINIPAGSLVAGNDSLTVNYSPDTTSSSIYNSASTSISVTVTVPPSFTLSASPTSESVAQNASITSTITVTDLGGFTGTVVLAASGLPGGVTPSFAAGTAAGTQVLTLTAASTAAVGGTVTVTITGTSGALSAVTTISLTVTAQPAFGPSGASGSDAAITVGPGATTGNTSIISVAGTNGYSGTVNLSCSVSPTAANDAATCSLSPASITLSGSTAQTSTLTVTTTAASSVQNQVKKLLGPSVGGTVLALLLLIGVPRRRRNWLATLGLAVLIASIGASGCGGGNSSGGSPVRNSGTSAGAYTVTVTGAGTSSGSSSPVTATVGTVTLTVN